MLIGVRNLSLKIFYLVRISILSRISGIYELCAHTMSGSESKWNDLMRDMLMGKEESHQGTLLGAWKAQAGGVMNTIYHLWHYPDLDNRFSTLITAVLQFPLPFHPAFLVFYSVSVCISSFLWKYYYFDLSSYILHCPSSITLSGFRVPPMPPRIRITY